METVGVSMAESFDTPAVRATQDAPFDRLRTERVRLGLDVDLSARGGYGVTLIRAGNTLHGWRFPAEVLKAAVPRFEGASCFVDHVGWFQQAASLGDLVGVISEVEWSETEGGLTGRLRLSNTPAGDWMEALIDQIIEDRENGLPVPNVGLSADMLAGYLLDGQTRVATEIRSVYSVDAVFYPASGGSFDRVLNSMAMGRKVEGGGKVEERVKERVGEVGLGVALVRPVTAAGA
ncbi:MAG TPA: hypothetical protein VM075_11090 [Anaerolineae bacterium]|nr:hypothetical protein [Anaerolineae bacterium]